MQPASHVGHHVGHVLPTDGLPNAIFFLTHGGRMGAICGMLQKQFWKGRLHTGPKLFAASSEKREAC
jgi:hypothetical protein